MASNPTRNPPPAPQASTHQTRDSETEPRLPHEHDESADSQSHDAANTPAREIGEKAFEDVRAGRVDTDRGPVMDRLYRRNLRRGGPRQRGPR